MATATTQKYLDAEGVSLLWSKIKTLVNDVDAKTEINKQDITNLYNLVEEFKPIAIEDLDAMLYGGN